MKNLLYLCVFLLLPGFTFIKHHKSELPTAIGQLRDRQELSHKDSAKVTFVECDKFMDVALDRYTIAAINRSFSGILHCDKEPVVNCYDSGVTDTIYTFSDAGNIIRIYRAKQDDFVFTFDVTDPVFKLAGNISTGMSKTAILRKFNLTGAIKNELQIVNAMGSMNFTFYFENNILTRINSSLYLN